MRKPLVSDSDPGSLTFDRDRHINYLLLMYQLLPSPYQDQEINRLTLAYYVISSLDIFSALDRIDKEEAICWVLSLQAHPNKAGIPEHGQFYGFHGSRSSQFRSSTTRSTMINGSHLASTYCALAILKILGYDLSLISSQLLLKSMKHLQQPNGCFMPAHTGGEKDLRFVFCAAAICSMLKNWSGMDCGKAKEYIINCQSYDGGFGLIPGSESHGGATYCAVASLKLMGCVEEHLIIKDASSHRANAALLLDWCLQKQAEDGGFRGRSNKPADTCYAFWIGGVLRLIGADNLISKRALREFLLTCQSEYGGFSKFPGIRPDLYHSYYGLCAFSMLNETGLNPICVELGISEMASVAESVGAYF